MDEPNGPRHERRGCRGAVEVVILVVRHRRVDVLSGRAEIHGLLAISRIKELVVAVEVGDSDDVVARTPRRDVQLLILIDLLVGRGGHGENTHGSELLVGSLERCILAQTRPKHPKAVARHDDVCALRAVGVEPLLLLDPHVLVSRHHGRSPGVAPTALDDQHHLRVPRDAADALPVVPHGPRDAEHLGPMSGGGWNDHAVAIVGVPSMVVVLVSVPVIVEAPGSDVFERVLPDVALEVRVIDVKSRVHERDDHFRVSHGARALVPRLGRVDIRIRLARTGSALGAGIPAAVLSIHALGGAATIARGRRRTWSTHLLVIRTTVPVGHAAGITPATIGRVPAARTHTGGSAFCAVIIAAVRRVGFTDVVAPATIRGFPPTRSNAGRRRHLTAVELAAAVLFEGEAVLADVVHVPLLVEVGIVRIGGAILERMIGLRKANPGERRELLDSSLHGGPLDAHEKKTDMRHQRARDPIARIVQHGSGRFHVRRVLEAYDDAIVCWRQNQGRIGFEFQWLAIRGNSDSPKPIDQESPTHQDRQSIPNARHTSLPC
jgi:hypothetical protein